MLHWDSLHFTFCYFLSTIRTALGFHFDSEKIMFGTDEETSLIDAIKTILHLLFSETGLLSEKKCFPLGKMSWRFWKNSQVQVVLTFPKKCYQVISFWTSQKKKIFICFRRELLVWPGWYLVASIVNNGLLFWQYWSNFRQICWIASLWPSCHLLISSPYLVISILILYSIKFVKIKLGRFYKGPLRLKIGATFKKKSFHEPIGVCSIIESS